MLKGSSLQLKGEKKMNNSTNINIEKSRNTEAQQNWYERRDQFLSNVRINDIANNFSLFATRQKITRFIETFRYQRR